MAVVFEILMVEAERNRPVRRIPVQFHTQQEAQNYAEVLAKGAASISAVYRYIVRPLDSEADEDRASVTIPPSLNAQITRPRR